MTDPPCLPSPVGRHANIPSPPNHNQDGNPSTVLRKLLSNNCKFYGSVKSAWRLRPAYSAGWVLAIVGRSGCGKKYPYRLIANQEQQSYGEISLSPHEHLPRRITAMIYGSCSKIHDFIFMASIEQNVQTRVAGTTTCHCLRFARKVGLKEKAGLLAPSGTASTVLLWQGFIAPVADFIARWTFGALDALTHLRHAEFDWKFMTGTRAFAAILVTHDVRWGAVQLADRIILLDRSILPKSFKSTYPPSRQRYTVQCPWTAGVKCGFSHDRTKNP